MDGKTSDGRNDTNRNDEMTKEFKSARDYKVINDNSARDYKVINDNSDQKRCEGLSRIMNKIQEVLSTKSDNISRHKCRMKM